MHILYLHQHFALPEGSTGTRSYEMARRWVMAGHQVTLICGRSNQCGIQADDKKIQTLEVEGFCVKAVNTKYANKQTFWTRVSAFISFMFWSFWIGLKVKDVDVIFATSTPLTIGVPAMLLKWFKRIPFIFEVRDQWPQVPIEMGFVKNPLLKKFLLWLERRIYKSSAGIVALSPGMADGVKNVLGSIEREMIIASNSSDTQNFRPDVDGSQIRALQGWQDKFILLHFGAMGKANGLDFLVDLAERLKSKPGIHIVIVGTGSEKSRLRDRISELELSNIEILDTFPKKQMPQVVAACDVSAVIFAKYPILEDNSANKFFDSLSAGKPVLLNYKGWQHEYVQKYECGYTCRQYDLDEYHENLMLMYNNPEQLQKMKKNARRLAEAEFDRDIISSRILNLIEKVNNSKSKRQ